MADPRGAHSIARAYLDPAPKISASPPLAYKLFPVQTSPLSKDPAIVFHPVHPRSSAALAFIPPLLPGPPPWPRLWKTVGLSLQLSTLAPGCGGAGLSSPLQSAPALFRPGMPWRPPDTAPRTLSGHLSRAPSALRYEPHTRNDPKPAPLNSRANRQLRSGSQAARTPVDRRRTQTCVASSST